MAESAKTGENERLRSRTARAHHIFDICDLILRSNFFKLQILSPLNLWLNYENLTHSPFKELINVRKIDTYICRYSDSHCFRVHRHD